MFAYRIPDLIPSEGPERIRDGSHPGLARIALAGPWQFSAHPEGGALATWRSMPVQTVDMLGEAVPCADGLTYYRPKVLPTQAQLAKDARSEDEIDVTLESGAVLTILLARSAPRRLRFVGASSVGEPTTEYGQLARDVYRRLSEATPEAPVTSDDVDVRRLVFLAIAQRYRVTEEVLDDIGWLSTADVDPILCALWGSAGKASAAATGT